MSQLSAPQPAASLSGTSLQRRSGTAAPKCMPQLGTALSVSVSPLREKSCQASLPSPLSATAGLMPASFLPSLSPAPATAAAAGATRGGAAAASVIAAAAKGGPLAAKFATYARQQPGLITRAAADASADGETIDKLMKEVEEEASLSINKDPSLSTTAPVSPRVFQCVLIACLGAFAFGYHISVVNGPLPYILADIGATGSPLVGGWIVSISLASAAVGAILGGLLADSLGRRRTLMLVSFPFILGSALSALASSIPQMLVGRAVVGASFGIVSSVVPLYISEVSPPSVRGAYGSLNQLTICIGIVAALIAGLPLAYSASWWRAMFWIGAIPAVLLAAGMAFVAPETPDWLQRKGRLSEAKDSETFLSGQASPGRSGSSGSSSPPRGKPGPLAGAIEEALGEKEVGMAELFTPKYRKVVGVGMLLFAIQQFSGINAVVYFSSAVFQKVGITSDLLASALVAVANVAGTLASSQLVDSQGRKKLLISSFAGMGLSMLLLALTLTTPALQPLVGLLSVLGTVTYVLSFAFGVGPVPALLLPEIFPAAIRANAIAVSLMAHWVCNFLIGLSFLQVVEAIGVGGAYAGFAFVCGLGILFVHFVVPETKGKSLEEIEALFVTKEA